MSVTDYKWKNLFFEMERDQCNIRLTLELNQVSYIGQETL